jgi:hypothetical protein
MEFKLSDPLSRRQMSSGSVEGATIRTQVRVILDEEAPLEDSNGAIPSGLQVLGVVTDRLPTTQTPTNERKSKLWLSNESHYKDPHTG